MKKVISALVGATCGLALAMGGVAWASDGGNPGAPARAAITIAPGGNSGSCC
ncbi:hypothetical protein LN042_27930 [Kitasatospora sp. RB6PN24]|uniref:hypothetical protein n=1 Tax=Kitasatospora humi TaxID=2893891 RepID=UPI001E393AB4|nr:hypothetical protein [Kitasatospora humi]MCC9310854.1 hypothetical protein [Kitasatospora humi]